MEDVAGPLSGGRLSTKARLVLARLFIFLIGMFLLVWSLWYPLGQDLWDYMAVTGAIYFIGATALLVHPRRMGGARRLPLLAIQRVGTGKVMFLGVEGTWRWRKAVGDRYHYRFWATAVRWMVRKRFDSTCWSTKFGPGNEIYFGGLHPGERIFDL